jgi:glycosyltransferase involved in cell wall biosynthesis
MKKGYYIYYTTTTEFLGVDRKISDQIKVFNNISNCKKVMVEREKFSIIKSIIWRMPFGSFGRDYDKAMEDIIDPDYIYIRFVPIDRSFLNFIKRLRISHPTCKIILEIATYPYSKELIYDITMFPFYFKDRFYNKGLKRYVDKIVTFSDDNEIFGIPTIKIINGIDVASVKCLKHNMEKDSTIRLLAVAKLQKSHGYERVISGLKKYYEDNHSKRVEVHIVGDGTELDYYKNLVKEYKLEDYVVFYGAKVGDELDAIYDLADIGLSCFGLYKRGINKISALKVGEYLSKGLPVVSGGYEAAFKDDKKYYLEFPNDNTPVDISKIVEFYNSIYENVESLNQVHEEIREYAKNTIDVSITMKPIVDYLMN